MEVDEMEATSIPFQLQFDKPIASQIKIAEWNPEKDLLAMVTEDSKILLHRFNWQRLWTVSPGRCITSLCWRPDGKAIAVGLEDGTISLHDVENGKLLRSIKSHSVAVVCLNWEEDGQPPEDDGENILNYEDRTSRFFPAAPRVPRMPGLSATDAGFMDDAEDSFRELSNSLHQRLNILCSGDKDGSICFSIFGIFPIGKINVHKFPLQNPLVGTKTMYRLLKASICKISLSKDLRQLIVLSYGEHIEDMTNLKDNSKDKQASISLHSLLLNTSIFRNRKNELHQMAQQSSNIEDLIEVVRVSLSLMHKQWADAMRTFHEKFDPLSSLIIDHGLDSTSQEEFLSLLSGARTSPPIHQFLVNSLGEAGLKRVSKAIDSAAKELLLIVRDHLQPAAEIIAFRSGELKGLSRWRARYHSIGLDEKLVNNAMEKAGMLLVQVERFLRVLAGVAYQFQNFFAWLSKCIKLLMSEPSDQLQPFNCELIVVFLKFLYNQDPVRQLLENAELNHSINIDQDTMQRVEELVKFGGFSDTEYLQRTLTKEFEEMEDSFKLAFLMPFTTISKKIYCEDLWPLFPLPSSPTLSSFNVPTSVSFYQDVVLDPFTHISQKIQDYVCFKIPEDSVSDLPSTVGIVRGFAHDYACKNEGHTFSEAALLHIPAGFQCVDLSLYKESQVVLLLNETTATSESPGKAWLMIVEASTLPFVSVPRVSETSMWWFHDLMNFAVELNMERGKIRSIPHSVTAPLAVSTSRGLACVFASRRRALVYILEEDEDEVSEME
ncbi:anaphase-promoting complex subunit 4 [Aristolochia californica]|uniref:anaphase-promoting complex subunit 4 n=1 Tax=Aristolochia californica TaxID=171875 RepID=UPI0035DBE182